MPDMSVKQAIEVLAQHAAQTRNPSILAAIKHVESGLSGQQEHRPMDRHDSPGMRAARAHTRPEYRTDRAKETATATAKSGDTATKENSTDE